MSNLHTLQSKLQNVVINESNSNHIIENSSHIIKKSINIENCENNKLNEYEKDIENGHVHVDTREQQLTDFSEIISQNYYHHPTEIQLNDTKSLEDLEIVEMTRELPNETTEIVKITYKVYESELELPSIMKLIQKDLSEPYSIYTYRYFIHNWPKLCYLAIYENKCIGCIVCKLDIHRQMIKRGYIAMLAVDKDYRKLKIGTTLVQKAIRVSLTLFINSIFFLN